MAHWKQWSLFRLFFAPPPIPQLIEPCQEEINRLLELHKYHQDRADELLQRIQFMHKKLGEQLSERTKP